MKASPPRHRRSDSGVKRPRSCVKCYVQHQCSRNFGFSELFRSASSFWTFGGNQPVTIRMLAAHRRAFSNGASLSLRRHKCWDMMDVAINLYVLREKSLFENGLSSYPKLDRFLHHEYHDIIMIFHLQMALIWGYTPIFQTHPSPCTQLPGLPGARTFAA